MYRALDDEISNILQLSTEQEAKEHQIAANRVKIGVLENQISDTRNDLLDILADSTRDDELDSASAKLKIAFLEDEISKIYELRSKEAIGSPRAKSLAKKENQKYGEIEENNRTVDQPGWRQTDFRQQEIECARAIGEAEARLSQLRDQNANDVKEASQNELLIKKSVQSLNSMFKAFENIRADVDGVSKSIGMSEFRNEIHIWAAERLPVFSVQLGELKDSIDDLRVRSITRDKPLNLLLTELGIDYDQLRDYLVKKVPDFSADIARSLIYELSNQALKALVSSYRNSKSR